MIRRRLITGEPVLLAPGRALRPHALGGDEPVICPFCPGHEHETPPEIWRDGDPWSIRVVPNKYPAAERHEVIVESSDHGARFEDADAERVVGVYFDRYRALSPFGHVTVFKNDGPAAGASLEHVHSQVLATPFVPPRFAREAEAFASAAACPLCAIEGEPSIAESEHYRVIAPRGSALAYEQWIVPREHAGEMREPHELGSLLRAAARVTRSVAPGFNWVFANFPHQPRAHWYVNILPRVAGLAGYEVGTGGAINIIDPEDAATVLRGRV